MKPRRAAALLMTLVVISIFATALESTFYVQELMTFSLMRGAAGVPDFGFYGWATFALKRAIWSIVVIVLGYWGAGRSSRSWLSIEGQIVPIAASAGFAVLGMVVYSRMAPASQIRPPEDLRPMVFEILAQGIALLGFGGIIRGLLAEPISAADPRLKEK